MIITDTDGDTREVDPKDAVDALTDALADLLHIHGGDQAKVEREYQRAIYSARNHYRAEKREEA